MSTEDEDLLVLDRGNEFESDEDEELEGEEIPVEEVEVDPEPIEEEQEIHVPKSRLDEVIAQREEERDRTRRLEAQLEKVLAQLTQPKKEDAAPKPVFDFNGAEEKYAELLGSGEYAKAAKIRTDIDAVRRQELFELVSSVKEAANIEAKQFSSSAVEEQAFQNLVDKIEAENIFLDPSEGNKKYNAEAVDTINALMAGYAASGKTKAESLKLAVNKVKAFYAEPEVKTGLGDSRKQAAGQKAVQAAKAQPAKTTSNGTPNSGKETLNIGKMTEAEFGKLTKAELKALRGD